MLYIINGLPLQKTLVNKEIHDWQYQMTKVQGCKLFFNIKSKIHMNIFILFGILLIFYAKKIKI